MNPSYAIGGVWPPAFISILDPWKIPLLNTFLLLSSGASVTWAHHSIILGSKSQGVLALKTTIMESTGLPFIWQQDSMVFMLSSVHAFYLFACFVYILIILQENIILGLRLLRGIGIL
eukprot:gene2933-4001_t